MDKLFSLLLILLLFIGLSVVPVLAEEECDVIDPKGVMAASWVYFIFSGPGAVKTINYSNSDPIDLRIGTMDCCILDDVVEIYVDDCLIGVHRSIDGIKTTYHTISLRPGNHVIKLVNTVSKISASGWYYELVASDFTSIPWPCGETAWREEIQVGDILLCRSPSSAVSISGEWTHAGIYVGNGQVVEALPTPGVTSRNITTWDFPTKTWVVLLRVRGGDGNRAAEFARNQVGQPYDYALWQKNMDPNSERSEGWYCSELVWAAYFNQGINIEHGPDSGVVSPTEISLDDNVAYINDHLESRPPLLCGFGLGARTGSPIDLIITDSVGLTISKELNEIPEAAYMEDDIDEDNELEDLIGIPGRKIGDYQIIVIPEPNASPTDTYTLEVLGSTGDEVTTIILAENVQIGDIPTQPYIVRSTESTVMPVITVEIDIKPGSWPNPINPDDKGVIPVAILTTSVTSGESVDFDATTVDPLSVKFGPGEATEAHGKGHIEDVDEDGDLDMVLHFETQKTGIKAGDTEACLTGETLDGKSIKGCDAIVTVPPKGKGKATLALLNFDLGQNFKNPFNPDTWIPYTLARDVYVVIHIYNSSGQLVRTLDFGYQRAGAYLSKGKAAYWDGKDSFGEKVASGVYFYTLQAGEFSATRKMVIMK